MQDLQRSVEWDLATSFNSEGKIAPKQYLEFNLEKPIASCRVISLTLSFSEFKSQKEKNVENSPPIEAISSKKKR